MPQRLVNLSASAPGFYGLNKQQSGDVLPPGWASTASNCAFDTVGRLAARKGTKNQHASATGTQIDAAHEYIDGAGNRLKIFSADDEKIYKIVGSTVTDITGTATITAGNNNWQFANFNGKCVGFHSGENPIVLSTTGGTFADITLTGTDQPTSPDNVFAGFGRLWCIEGSTLHYSDPLDETAWNGSLNLFSVWRHGSDEGVAVSEFNGLLLIFGKRNIAIYQRAADPTAVTFSLVENIANIGCIARDSIQAIGDDLLFLSYTGVRSLKRTIENAGVTQFTGVAPLNDISRNNRDYIMGLWSASEKVKSVHHELDRFYLLSFPSQAKVFCFDVWAPLEDGSFRMTEWDVEHNAYISTYDSELWIAHNAFMAKYEGFTDGQTSAGAAGTSYKYEVNTAWMDFGEEVENHLKIPKKGSLHYVSGSSQNILYKWAFDYRNTFNTRTIISTEYTVAEYNGGSVPAHEFGTAEFSGGGGFEESSVQTSRNGRIVMLGCEISAVDDEFALQRIDMQAKLGKLLV